ALEIGELRVGDHVLPVGGHSLRRASAHDLGLDASADREVARRVALRSVAEMATQREVDRRATRLAANRAIGRVELREAGLGDEEWGGGSGVERGEGGGARQDMGVVV